MKNLIYKIIVILIILSFSFNSEKVNNIIIVGNSRTIDSIILNQIQHPVGITFNSAIAKNDLDRLVNMNIFNAVNIELNENTYYVTVKEKKLLSFSPIVEKEDGIGWSLGPILNINNIKGQGRNVNIGIAVGAIKSGNLQYTGGKIAWEYYYNQHKSIESDYWLNKKKLLFHFTINKEKGEIILTPQINENRLKYSTSPSKTFKHLTLSAHYITKNTNSPHFISSNFIYNYALDKNNNYARILISYNYKLKINNLNNSSSVLFRTKLIINSDSNSPDFEYVYLGGENYVRGYYPNPADNPEEITQKLKFKNLLFQSVQFEAPFTNNHLIKTKLLFFYDSAIGSTTYDQFSHNNKLKGYGWGISIETVNKMRFDICIGLNHFGSRTIHFINNING